MKQLFLLLLALAASTASATLMTYIPGQWSIQSVTANGQPDRFGPFKTREECEAAIKKIEVEQHTHGSKCVQAKDAPQPTAK
jgi:hypothetical protein